MPETSLRNDEQIRRNIELAYIGLTFKGELVDAASLTKEVISIGRMAADNSLAVLVQKSARLVGTIKDIQFEESSQRYLVTFRANNSDEDEIVRSERVDSQRGETVKELWGRNNLGGHRVVLYKHNERVGEDKKREKGYRVAPWVTDLGPAR